MPTFTEEYRSIDKSDWDEGPWRDEPDKVVWVDEKTGLDCMIRRGGGGALCGYVGVGPDHLWFGKSYCDCLIDCGNEFCYEHTMDGTLEVHGGVTFAGMCSDEGHPEEDICHISPAPVYWIGFDCGHYQDLRPSATSARNGLPSLVFPGDVYRGLAYVIAEVEALAVQLSAVGKFELP
jgi:hypothetical protein